MNYYVKILIDRLEWTEDDTLLVGYYRNMKLIVRVKDDNIIDVTGWVYVDDDWDIMYELIDSMNEIKYYIKKKYLYEPN